MATIELREVRKSYGETQVVHGLDARFEPGEFVVIVGPSGCGKSTLLRMIAGLEAISGGEIAIGDKVVNALAPKERDVAMVFQNYALYPHMSVFDNMAYSLKLAKVPKPEIQERVANTAGILGLGELLHRRPNQLSGGQRQRVAMGRAIVREPKVFLFDEPLSNLDATLRVQMRVEIKQLHRELGATSVFVTHDQVEAMTMADRLVVMNAGLVEQVGRPVDVYNRPATRFVASFIGSPAMNFLKGTLDARTDGYTVRLKDGTPVDAGAVEGARSGEEVSLGIRPEHLRPASAEAGASLSGRISLIEELGSSRLVHLETANGRMVSNIAVEESGDWQIGEDIGLSVAPKHTHLFDRESGLRLDHPEHAGGNQVANEAAA
ncbi:sn-glycerol-3-phosphate ABC transporter ATP-binding protein UgpC [Nisaea acidiphila]|uniref:Sn-glycerol-3-phosphate ABC transporter ATP-binding protein UgpC n=1 Tax=Nisaea acidiphila TaxID=1862145 RepID=A0A9J7ANM1_9PROT|nr:sn-glycerol-3-phosphate ABC transporter ATP-binding protein UgpC [Nisaea acidiphila]UUX48791.1 sn-glycerol-3-phosphate ABC transporter ATP-binding protein UgpC [Nisaea acidiphila]